MTRLSRLLTHATSALALMAVSCALSPAFAQHTQPVAAAGPVEDQPPTGSDTVTIYGRAFEQIGEARSASEGVVGYADLSTRPISRAAELVEVIPGMIATEHSSGGKANQYFLRGFNLDHGTDFAGFVDGVPINSTNARVGLQ